MLFQDLFCQNSLKAIRYIIETVPNPIILQNLEKKNLIAQNVTSIQMRFIATKSYWTIVHCYLSSFVFCFLRLLSFVTK